MTQFKMGRTSWWPVLKDRLKFSQEFFYIVLLFCDSVTDFLQVSNIIFHFTLQKCYFTPVFQAWSLIWVEKTKYVGIILIVLKWIPGSVFYCLNNLHRKSLVNLMFDVSLYPLTITKYQVYNLYGGKHENRIDLIELEILRGCLDTPLQLLLQGKLQLLL